MTATSKAYQSHKASVLIIEDNPDQWFIIRWALLRCFPEIEPHWVASDLEALRYLEHCIQELKPLPSVILLDLYLPNRQTGWNLLQILKQHDLYQHIPVLMLSHSNDPKDMATSYRYRSHSYIVKPTTYDQWLSCMTEFRQYWWQEAALIRNN